MGLAEEPRPAAVRRHRPADLAEGDGPAARCAAGARRRAARAARLGRCRIWKPGFAAAAAADPGRIGVVIGYDEGLAHLIQGGCDVLLVPSRFEPCGLTQLCALRYGALPLVARTGGLADTVIDANEMALAAGVATGWQFAPATARCAGRRDRPRAAVWPDRAAWRRMQRNAMATRCELVRPRAPLRRSCIARSRRADCPERNSHDRSGHRPRPHHRRRRRDRRVRCARGCARHGAACASPMRGRSPIRRRTRRW